MGQVVGVDVSKDRLDGLCRSSGRRPAVANDPAGAAELVGRGGGGRTLRVTEASGGYERPAHRLLAERGVRVAIANAKRVRNFAEASGVLARTDRLGAAAVARYGAFAQPAPTPVPEGARAELAEPLACRRRLTPEIGARRQSSRAACGRPPRAAAPRRRSTACARTGPRSSS